MNVKACLERIRHAGPLGVSLSTLTDLQRTFMLAVPFENLDIHLGRRIEIKSDRVYRKVVENRRGGFCFELNGLFHDLLAEIGFDVKFLAARMVRPGDRCPDFGHMILRVDLQEPWLVDVGNGKSSREPLRMDGSNETSAEGVRYRVSSSTVLEKLPGEHWRTRFTFSPIPRNRAEFEEVCHWTQTSPESVFTKNRVCTVARPDGRVTLLNSTLTVADGAAVSDSEISPEALTDCLRTHFGILLQ